MNEIDKPVEKVQEKKEKQEKEGKARIELDSRVLESGIRIDIASELIRSTDQKDTGEILSQLLLPLPESSPPPPQISLPISVLVPPSVSQLPQRTPSGAMSAIPLPVPPPMPPPTSSASASASSVSSSSVSSPPVTRPYHFILDKSITWPLGRIYYHEAKRQFLLLILRLAAGVMYSQGPRIGYAIVPLRAACEAPTLVETQIRFGGVLVGTATVRVETLFSYDVLAATSFGNRQLAPEEVAQYAPSAPPLPKLQN